LREENRRKKHKKALMIRLLRHTLRMDL